jgi:DNA-binding beta-propeller fold protein YncE
MVPTRVFDIRLVLHRRPGRHKHTGSVSCGEHRPPQWSRSLVIAVTLTLLAAIGVPSGAQAAYVQQWARGTTGTAEHQFEGPEGIAVASGKVFASDFGNHRIQVFNGFGAFQYMWGFGVQDGFPMFESCTSSCRAGIAGAANGQFRYPVGLAATSSGDVYVADSQNDRIQRFTAGGLGAQIAWGSLGSANGQFNNPLNVALDSHGRVYVADANNDRIEKFSASGTFLTKWGHAGQGPGQFDRPVGVAVGLNDRVYVTDQFNNRVEEFSPSGTFVRQWGTSGDKLGQFHNPTGIATDSQGNVYVVDNQNNRIEKFTASGTFLTAWGKHGSGANRFSSPGDVAVDGAGHVYVTDYGNDRIVKYANVAP